MIDMVPDRTCDVDHMGGPWNVLEGFYFRLSDIDPTSPRRLCRAVALADR